jgi:hypothetical protein
MLVLTEYVHVHTEHTCTHPVQVLLLIFFFRVLCFGNILKPSCLAKLDQN